MSTRIVSCPDCGTAVPHGRLSCVACGALLASVAGTRQPATVAPPTARPSRAQRLARRAAPKASEHSPSLPSGPAVPPPPPGPALAPTASPVRPPDPGPARGPSGVPSLVAAPAGATIAGAYLPPSAVFAVSADATAARGRITNPLPATPNATPAAAAPARGGATTRRAGPLADITLDAPDDVETWLVAVGAAFTVIGFVLPWGDNGMIGGGVDRGFFSRWGLANAADSVPLLAGLVALWLQLTPSVRRTPARTALVGLLLGGPLVGLAFVYATSPFGLGTGGVGVLVGAALLLAGGGLALRPRHARNDPAV